MISVLIFYGRRVHLYCTHVIKLTNKQIGSIKQVIPVRKREGGGQPNEMTPQ